MNKDYQEKLELKILLEHMDIPAERANDKLWLMRNLGVKNKAHPDFNRAMELIKKMPVGVKK